MKATVFARSEDFERFRDRLEEYQYQSKQVQVEYIDPEKRPALAERLKENALGTVVFEYEGRTERVTSDAEQDLTNGLIKVRAGQRSTRSTSRRDTANATRPAPTSAATARSPRSSAPTTSLSKRSCCCSRRFRPTRRSSSSPAEDGFLPPEIEMLKGYLDKGGKLLVLLDPPEKADAPPLTNLTALLKDWAIEVGNNVVLDLMSQLLGTDASVPVAAPPYPSHPITSNFRLLTAFPLHAR